MFGWVMVPKNVEWFKKLLEYTLPLESEDGGEEARAARSDPRLRNVIPKQVVGTVLALNGWRLYFSMYHPKHEPSMKGYRGPGQCSLTRISASRSGGGWLGRATAAVCS